MTANVMLWPEYSPMRLLGACAVAVVLLLGWPLEIEALSDPASGASDTTTVVERPPLDEHSITNDHIASFVADFNNDTGEPIKSVDWHREPDVGALNAIEERQTGVQRWLAGPRDTAHRLTTVTLDARTTQTILHDPQGRITDDGEADLVYGPRGRLLRSIRNGVVEHYVYDASGRLAQIINGKSRTIAWDGDQMIAALEPVDGVRWEAVWGAHVDQLLEFENFDTDDRRVAITDHRNSVVGWWNTGSEQLEHIIEYSEMGRVRLLDADGSELCEETGSTDCVRLWGLPQFGFAGAYRSERSGLTYMRNRWYSPRLGQFLSHDPLGYIDSHNLYAYAAFDPINFWDPYGLGSMGFADEGFGFDATCNGCFDTSQADPTGAVTAFRRGANGAENAAHAAGDANARFTNSHRDAFKQRFDRSSGLDALGAGVGFVLFDVYGQLTPQSGGELMGGLAMGALGPGLKGASVAGKLSRFRTNTGGPGAVNLDTSTVTALVADVTPHRDEIFEAIGDRTMVLTDTAEKEFLYGLWRYGSDTEVSRGISLLDETLSVADNPSQRVLDVPLGQNQSMNDRITFGTGDRLGVPTFTADKRFVNAVRSAKGGFQLDVFIHGASRLGRGK